MQISHSPPIRDSLLVQDLIIEVIQGHWSHCLVQVTLLELAIGRSTHCGQVIDMVSNNTQTVVFKQCPIGTKGPERAKKILHTIEPLPIPL